MHYESTEARFWAKVQKGDDCWEWRGERNWAGYGRFWLGGRRVTVHRLAYEMLVGPIPPGLQIDHLCRNRACVNPAHLEPVTCRDNLLRGETRAAANSGKTHCIRGHPFDATNTAWYAPNRRACRECSRLRARKQRGYKGLPPSGTRTSCPSGHPYDEANTYVWGSRRNCKACRLEYQRRRRAQRKGTPITPTEVLAKGVYTLASGATVTVP